MIKATILPNDRKYYGTRIHLRTHDGKEARFDVWINSISDYTPSEREIDFIGEDGKFYYREEDGTTWGYEICDDHYETQTALDVCKVICEAINERFGQNAS